MEILVTHIAKNGEHHIPYNKVLNFDFNANLVKIDGVDHKILNKQTGNPPQKPTVVAYDTRPVGDKDNKRQHKLYTNVLALPDVEDTRFIFD